ncbi:MAG: aldehyde dehydrogenase family protein [Bryobacteraceae bacterium]
MSRSATLDPDTGMGPQVSQDQMHKIFDYVRLGNGEGARCITGARADLDGKLARGCFLLRGR